MYDAQKTDDWNYQVSIKFGDSNEHMLNVRAVSAADLAARCVEMEAFAGEVIRLSRNVDNVDLLPPPAQDPNLTTYVPTTQQALAHVRERFPETRVVQTYGPPPQAPLCPHGQMKFIEKNSAKTGEPYKAYFCPADRNAPDKCPPRFVN